MSIQVLKGGGFLFGLYSLNPLYSISKNETQEFFFHAVDLTNIKFFTSKFVSSPSKAGFDEKAKFKYSFGIIHSIFFFLCHK